MFNVQFYSQKTSKETNTYRMIDIRDMLQEAAGLLRD
jgi:hypothetical protein